MKKVMVITLNPIVYNGITNVVSNIIKNTYKSVEYDLIITQNYDINIVSDLKKKCHSVFICEYNRNKDLLAYLVWLYHVMSNTKYDIVHIHANSATCFVEVLLAYLCSIPIRIVHSHSSHGKYPFIHKLLKIPLNIMTSHCLACSDLAGKWMFNKDYTLIYNAIDLNKFRFDPTKRANLRSKLNINGKIVLGHVGYMDVEKNHSFMIDLMAKLIEINKNYVLLLIGDGRLRHKIEQKIADYGISDSVIILGKRSDVNELYQCMDIFLLPSLWEGFPISIIEAQTSGLPCIVSNNITKQVDITKNVLFLKAEYNNITEWIVKIQNTNFSINNRYIYYKLLKNSIFNIKCLAFKILRIYGL